MEHNVIQTLLAGAIVGAAVTVLTAPQWQHLMPASGTLGSYAACIDRFQDMEDNGAMAQKSCKAQHVKKLQYGESTNLKAWISQNFSTIHISAEPGDAQDYERIVGTLQVFVDGKIDKKYPFTATSEEAHPSTQLAGRIEDGDELKGLTWCAKDEQVERCMEWASSDFYGLTYK